MSALAPYYLLPGEQLAYQATLHWIIYAKPGALIVLALPLVIGPTAALAVLMGLAGGAGLLGALLYAASTLWLLSDRRVMIKRGLLTRQAESIALRKIEATSIEQGLLGRLLDYGTVAVQGAGSEVVRFGPIARPRLCWDAVQQQVASLQP